MLELTFLEPLSGRSVAARRSRFVLGGNKTNERERRLDSEGCRCFDAEAEPIFWRSGQPPCLESTALFWVFIAMHGAAMAQDDKQDTVEVRGKSLVLSCAEWKRNENGSWTSTGPLLVGTNTVNEVTLRGAKETKVLEEKCGNGAAPSATPTRSDDFNATHEASAWPCGPRRGNVGAAQFATAPVEAGHAD